MSEVTETVPPKTPPTGQIAPISVGDWFITLIITAIPLVGFIMLFVWGFGSSTHPSKANWAKATLLLFVVAFGLFFMMSIIFGFAMMSSGY
ncbi:hypothetical protein FM042_04710 [Aliidiomarina halalkaliphila]|uniref:Uncharacterized protein n=1 Tax=Aliidiomarina halalkaliphila TaxID=2593535 RepID=A0A552X599_9GAMM|nr:hypothetical protein [Aliidiomarina halalkaliphila]TRW50139.1 hypothetical protein FM042_04710 [Aliidiomarina halalkaliphila]